MLTKEEVTEIVDRWFAGRNAIDKRSALQMAMKIVSRSKENAVRNVTKKLQHAPSVNEVQGKVTKH